MAGFFIAYFKWREVTQHRHRLMAAQGLVFCRGCVAYWGDSEF